MARVQLREICWGVSGDKGDISNFGLVVHDEKDYPLIKQKVTAERVKEFMKSIVKGKVERYELPKLQALNFVMHEALGGGSSRSLTNDAHGKSLSGILLSMEIEKPD